MKKEMSKAARNRLERSEFYRDTVETVHAMNYYQYKKETKQADEMMIRWQIARLALEHITGKRYEFKRTEIHEGLSVYAVRNGEDVLIQGHYQAHAE